MSWYCQSTYFKVQVQEFVHFELVSLATYQIGVGSNPQGTFHQKHSVLLLRG